MQVNSYVNMINSAYVKESNTKKEKWSTKKRYWISQVMGWSVFIIINLIIVGALGKFNWQRLAVYIVICFFGLLLTHRFRHYIKRIIG